MKEAVNLERERVIHEWPAEGLERVESCPVCGGDQRNQLYTGLTDRVFRCAPGRWSLYQCKNCLCAYLDPRPTLSTIGLAYSSYFTHEKSSQDQLEHLSMSRRIRRILANGYRNHRLGTRLRPTSRLGIVAAMLLPDQRGVLEAEVRHIPRASPGMRLLDVGCGNGEFLALARSAGWDVVGVEPDPKAVEVAHSRGLDVRQGSLDVFNNDMESFDGITLSHVIEHVHQPLTVLRKCYSMLKPGGWIWLDTPNLGAQGHQRFRSDWRDLDPPRHLVLFTRTSLIKALEQVGFKDINDQAYRPLCSRIYSASDAIANGKDPYAEAFLSRAMRKIVNEAEIIARHEPERREYITLKAYKMM